MTVTADSRCGGVVVLDDNGAVIHQFACEVHLFDEEVCAWQKRTNEQPWDWERQK